MTKDEWKWVTNFQRVIKQMDYCPIYTKQQLPEFILEKHSVEQLLHGWAYYPNQEEFKGFLKQAQEDVEAGKYDYPPTS